jgi:hypothetical protein
MDLSDLGAIEQRAIRQMLEANIDDVHLPQLGLLYRIAGERLIVEAEPGRPDPAARRHDELQAAFDELIDAVSVYRSRTAATE